MATPRIIDDEAFKRLRSGEIDGFHRLVADRQRVDFSNADLRGSDLRKADLSKVVLTGTYLRDTDLRGLDLRNHNLEGCSLHNAKIGGTYFPLNLTAAEIQMSVQFGTRLRVAPAVPSGSASAAIATAVESFCSPIPAH